LVIIGGGAAGFSAAMAGVEAGANVLLVSIPPLGGTCVNFGCIPTKRMLHVLAKSEKGEVKRMFASTYQAVSGSGAMGIAELERQVGEINEGREVSREVYPHQIAFNVLPHVDVFLDNGYTKEEMKMVHESRKIMGLPDFQASVTCVRVPVYRAHSIAISAEFEKPVSVEGAREAISGAPGIDLNDDVASNGYPLPLELAGQDNCQVGRIRKDCAMENGLSFWVAGDQLLKGAALNAIQIAEEVAKL